MNRQMQFTVDEMTLIFNALRIAAEMYSVDARDADLAHQPRVAEQFRKQRASACNLAERISAFNAYKSQSRIR